MSDVPTPTRRDLVQALAYSPTSRDIYYNLTRCEQAMRQYDAASATENRHESATPVVTQDGERPGLREAALALADYVEEMTKDGLRPNLELLIAKVRLAATPTPDDRDREVERIAAVLRSVPVFRTFSAADHAAFLYDAGLRASGGN